MSVFFDRLDEYLGDADDKGDIRAIVRRCWHYDIPGLTDPFGQSGLRMWDGQGRQHTSDGKIWMGSVAGNGQNLHKTPRLADGRDGTSLNYRFSVGYLDKATYEGIKADQSVISGATLTCWNALFQVGEGLRPGTPVEFSKELTLMSPEFDEKLELNGFSLVRRYVISVLAKDGNFGRSEIPGRTYTDTMQKDYAKSLGVELDRGCEFVAGLANRTYKVD